MIRYSLSCKKGHAFEAWFRSGEDYDRQAKRGLVSCAQCGSTKVEKSVMAPSVPATTRRKGSGEGPPATKSAEPNRQMMTTSTPDQAEMMAALRKMRDHVVSKSEYVGPKFAEEARKIHYEESPVRGIYGEASAEDVRSLHEEGVECYPLPTLPEDNN